MFMREINMPDSAKPLEPITVRYSHIIRPEKAGKVKGFSCFSKGLKHTVPLTISYNLFWFLIG